MAKRIILCADGTGNRGGYTRDSNVYTIYNAIEIHEEKPDKKCSQIKFYDNGVGTSKNKYLRGLCSAFGFGFKRNVCDLYEFLARNYEPEDEVFLFGFSRGAATIRAFSGFIAACGLVDGRTSERKALDKCIEKAFKVYRTGKGNPPQGGHGVISIKFIGVWDTVSALGFPQDWKITGFGTWVLSRLFSALDYLLNFGILAHRFYNYKLTENVEYAYQALAIDDERKTFKPMVWKEPDNSNSNSTKVEQVWFAGAHSNVGGGYGRTGLSNLALDWMMTRAHRCGLNFKPDELERVRRSADTHGRMYNSRDGFAIYYRYHPRKISALCQDKLQGKIKIHRSIFERLKKKTANYAPGNLPYEFDLVDTALESPAKFMTAADDKKIWEAGCKKINKWVLCRKWLYGSLLEFTLLVVISAGWFWINSPEQESIGGPAKAWTIDWMMGHIADVLNYFSPVYFEGLVTVAVIQNPHYFGSAVTFLLVLWLIRRFCQKRELLAREALRKMILRS